MYHAGRRGFTLLELLIVVLLLGVLAAFTWPEFSRTQRAEELDESARRVRALMQMCRARAMNDARRYQVIFRLDGSICVKRQRDPLLAPHEHYRFRESWATTPCLLEHVWVEAIVSLPEGPPPLLIEDDRIEFQDEEDDPSLEPVPIADFEQEVVVSFEPDGVSNSLRWVLRDYDGRGLEMTLDGRLGRVTIAPLPRLEPEAVRRPEPLEQRADEVFEDELEPLEQRL